MKRINGLVDDVRKVLHRYKVHVSTIQQEVAKAASPTGTGSCTISKSGCIEACEAENCCPEEVVASKAEAASLRRRRNTEEVTLTMPH